MNEQIREMAMRIRSLREDLGISVAEMAEVQGMVESDYLIQESGESDFSLTFLYNAASRMGVDIGALMTGAGPTLSEHTIVRKGGGLDMKRRSGFSYKNLAHRFRDREAEPFLVEAPMPSEGEQKEIPQRSHGGQEFDYVLTGRLRFRIGAHETILETGDSVYYNAQVPHGMVAHEGDCTFLAVIIRTEGHISY